MRRGAEEAKVFVPQGPSIWLGGFRELPLAFVTMTVDAGKEADFVSELKKIEHVSETYLTCGVYDVVAKIEAETPERLKEVIVSKVRMLNNVTSTVTMIADEGA
jgi:DNA-binding Lrp family transcriptional regulator